MKKSLILLLMLMITLFFIAGCNNADPETSSEMETDTEVTTEDTDQDQADTPAAYMDISPDDAFALIESTPDLVIIDVSPIYDQGHLPNAINYYVGDGSLDNAIPDLDMEVPYLVYCHNDNASISGAQKLIDAGFDPVYRLEGNYGAWVDAGYPVE